MDQIFEAFTLLVTYYQAAEMWTRKTFANAIVSQFESAEAKVRQ